jgi:uncharacterized protein
MTPQERDLIVQLFNRLNQAERQAKDRDAEALIKEGATHVPDAAYLLVQTVLIQDMALAEAEKRIKDLEQQPQQQPQQPPSFLAAARGSVPDAGPWGRAPSAPAAAPSPVWTNSAAAGAGAAAASAGPAQSLAAPGASSGFLRSAATTAAGVAGGALLFEGISSLFMPHYGNLLGGMTPQPGLGETVVNNYYGDQQQPPMDTGYDQTVQADDQDMNQDPGQDPGQDWGGGDGGDGGGNIDI